MSEAGLYIGAGRLRSFFERWQRMEADKQAIAEDLKELFAEAKGDGWNTKAMRAVFRDKAKLEAEDMADRSGREEFEAICDLYRDALDSPRAHPAPAREEKIEQFPPHDAETGELADQTEPVAATETTGNDLRKPAAVVSGQIIREGDAPRETDRQASDTSPGDGDASCPDTDFEPPAFLVKPKTAADYRPHCQKPEACGASGLRHCYSCQKLADAAESEAA